MSDHRLLLRLTRRTAGWTGLLGAMALAGAVADILVPAVLGGGVDSLLGRAGATERVPGGWTWLTGLRGPAGWLSALAALVVVVVGCETASQLGTGTATAAATAWLRGVLVRHMLAAGPRLTRHLPAGDVVSRVIGGAADAGGGPASAARAVAAVLPAAGAVAALALIDPWLALTLMAGFPVLAVLLRRFVADTSDVVTKYQQAQGTIAARLVEALAGAASIAAAGTRDREAARILTPLPALRAHGESTWRIQGRVSAQGTLLVPLLQVLVLAVGGLELAAGRISPGGLLAASQYAVLGASAGAAISYLGLLARARAGARRAGALLTVSSVAYGSVALPRGPGRVEWRAVTARSGGGAVVLDGVDLVVPGGAAVAVVGQGGSGKSLLTALVGRLAEPESGEVLLDGTPVRSLAHADLREAVQYAFARPGLLGRTPDEVIGFGPRPLPTSAVRSAARAACADDFIRRLPDGYQTPLVMAPMSGGERQRLGLARAFAHAAGARVLVLDDATSSLDTVTEMHVSKALTQGLPGLTRLIVAYRAATAARADLVAWLDNGRVRAYGTHQELWGCPGYRALFQSTTDTEPTPGSPSANGASVAGLASPDGRGTPSPSPGCPVPSLPPAGHHTTPRNGCRPCLARPAATPVSSSPAVREVARPRWAEHTG